MKLDSRRLLVLLILPFAAGCGRSSAAGEASTLAEDQSISYVADGTGFVVSLRTRAGAKLEFIHGTSDERVLIAEGKGTRFTVTPSPDGRLIAFSATNVRGRRSELYLYDLRAKRTKAISASGESAYWPEFSWDSKSLVYACRQGGQDSGIRMIDLDTGRRINLATSPFAVTLPTFSEDGSKVYFWKAESFRRSSPVGEREMHDWQIWEVDVNDRSSRPLFERKFYQILYSRPLIRGELLVFRVEAPSEDYLWMQDLSRPDVPRKVRLPSDFEAMRDEFGDSRVFIDRVKFANDKDLVLVEISFTDYIFRRDAPEELFLLNLDSADIRQVTRFGARIADFALSQNGDKIVVLLETGDMWEGSLLEFDSFHRVHDVDPTTSVDSAVSSNF